MTRNKTHQNRTALLRKRSFQRKLSVIFSWPFLAGSLLFLCAGLSIYYKNQIIEFYVSTQNSLKRNLIKVGFKVESLQIYGQRKTPLNAMHQAIGLRQGDFIFESNLVQIKDNLEKIDWIKNAVVKRTLPNKVEIYIQERHPIALWKHQNQYYLVDNEGVAIKIDVLESYRNLPLISGDGAAHRIEKILDLVYKFPSIAPHVKTFVRIRHRRWDMVIFQSLIIKLPDDMNESENLEHALENLNILIQKKKITPDTKGYVDMRLSGKTSIIPG